MVIVSMIDTEDCLSVGVSLLLCNNSNAFSEVHKFLGYCRRW